MKKISKKYTGWVATFYTTLLMSLLMCILLVAINTDIDSGYFIRVLKAWELAFPAAFFIFPTLRPLIAKLVEWSTDRA
ncbi:MAG: DUF2798 domain-containing protein [Neisseria sp.]|uniref:DUF2798 domain-containing protein n=1 Tax=Neisseria sp. TaxID=192066 RepID=UPI0026DCCD09|nr:DUF2798 domain-containing protein [Neisseria sp.]MDO4641255.1 DUF2798 domain-containing protein [Neisseria sp.]